MHEGPQRISKTGTERLQTGMIISNEPGYYREGAYGIRIENLVLVTPPKRLPGGDIAMHGFETLTLVPFDRRLIKTELLTREELVWLDAYNARVLSEIGPMVDGETLKWLEGGNCAVQPSRLAGDLPQHDQDDSTGKEHRRHARHATPPVRRRSTRSTRSVRLALRRARPASSARPPARR